MTPGPDGLNPAFYHKFWSVVGEDVTNVMRRFMNEGILPEGLNDTIVVLIPKKSRPETMGDLRPISLCNVLYKVISKVLANRLKVVLNHVISENQSAFIPGHLITDNVMVSFGILHYLKRKQSGKEGYMALKLDMSKAYDRVEWSYLLAVLRQMGFADKWVDLIGKCLSSVKYSVVCNGHEMGPIYPTRGIRQDKGIRFPLICF